MKRSCARIQRRLPCIEGSQGCNADRGGDLNVVGKKLDRVALIDVLGDEFDGTLIELKTVDLEKLYIRYMVERTATMRVMIAQEVHDANDFDEDWVENGCPACDNKIGGI